VPTHTLGPSDGRLEVHTYREGVAQKVGHDLIIEVEQWEASVDTGEGGGVSSATLQADSRSLQIRDGLHGLKPLSDRDRRQIRKNIDKEILLGKPIAFRSSAVREDDGRMKLDGELELAGTTRPASFELDVRGGRAKGTLPLVQSDWGIKPYRGMMGALKVRDDVEIVLDVELPAS
jgi:polyisoprenoid-binding protein YceI